MSPSHGLAQSRERSQACAHGACARLITTFLLSHLQMRRNPLPSRPQELRPRSGDRRLLRPPAPLSAENNLLGRRTDRPLQEVGAPGVLLRPQQLRSCPSPPASSSGPLVDPQPTRCDLGAPPPRGRSVPAHPSSTPLDTPLISPLHSKPLSHTTSHPFASLAGSRRHRGRPVVRALLSRMWAVF